MALSKPNVGLWHCGSVQHSVTYWGGRNYSTKYQSIQEMNVPRSVKKLKKKIGWPLQQDNDPKCTLNSTITTDLFIKKQ